MSILVHTFYYSRLEKPTITACHPRNTNTYLYIFHDRRKSIGKKHGKKRRKRKGMKREKSAKINEKGKERNGKTRKARKDKTRGGSKERKEEKKM